MTATTSNAALFREYAQWLSDTLAPDDRCVCCGDEIAENCQYCTRCRKVMEVDE